MPEKIIKYQIVEGNFVKFNCVEVTILPDGRMDIVNAAKLIGLKPKSLSVMIHRPNMPPFVKIAGKVYFYYKDIEKWLKSHKKINK
jgi:predicted DNA-binding transcriptional regulator AlpA